MPPDDAATNHADLLRHAQEHRHVSLAEIRARLHGAGRMGRFNINTRQLEILQELRASQLHQDQVLAAIAAKLGIEGPA